MRLHQPFTIARPSPSPRWSVRRSIRNLSTEACRTSCNARTFAAVAKSPIDRIRAFACERGWRHLRLLSSAGTSYNRDYHGETPDGAQLPALNVFVRRDGRIHHFYAAELLYAPTEPGQDPRHVDLIWPIWNLLDVTPTGREGGWDVRLSYDESPGSGVEHIAVMSGDSEAEEGSDGHDRWKDPRLR